MKSTHPPARKTFSFFATSDATTNERRLTPRLTHDPSARSFHERAFDVSRACRSRQARDEVELLMRRDRAGCWITMDEILFFETCAFEVWCEKERWASGRVVRTVEMDDGVESAHRGAMAERTNEEDERDVVRSSSNENESDGDGEKKGARRSSRDGWALELDASVPALVASAGVSFFGDEKNATAQTPSSPAVPVLGLELCLVGTCAGDHLAMTRECELAAWKVTSPRSFVSRLAMCVISEEMSSSESWSEDDSAEEEPRFETSRGEDLCATISARLGNDAFLAFAERNGANDETSAARAAGGDAETAAPAPAPWSIVPWKSHAVAFDRAEVLRNVRKRYEDLMREYHDSGSELRGASDELFAGELTWFSAGIRVGVGMGLGVCLGLGLGVGILVNGYRSSRDRLSDVRQALRLR